MNDSLQFPHILRKPTATRVKQLPLQPPQEHTVEESASSIGDAPCCSVCHTRTARYTCPRCYTPYCSSSCFPSHNPNANCSEHFYRDRVVSVQHLEVKAQATQTKQLLQRQFEQQRTDVGLEKDTGIAPCGIPYSELYEFLLALDQGERKMKQFLRERPEFQNVLDRELVSMTHHTNDVSQRLWQDWVLEPWQPWWLPQLLCEQSNNNDAGDDHEDTERPVTSSSELDEFLVHRLPRLPAQCSPQLPFHVLQVLCAATRTFRLYHGLVNALHLVPEAVESLFEMASVLRPPEPPSNGPPLNSVKDVLSSHPTAFSDALVRSDVMAICAVPRYTARCLWETHRLIQARLKAVTTTTTKQRSIWRKALKKLEFFVAWNQQYASNLARLVPLLQQQYDAKADDDDDDTVPRVVLPQPPATCQPRIQINSTNDNNDSFLLREVSVTRHPSTATTLESS